jgi:hypothetical protein
MRRTKKVVHSSRELRNAADAAVRSRALRARPSTAAQNEEKNGLAGTPESEWSKIEGGIEERITMTAG